jgi:hypothetical protein
MKQMKQMKNNDEKKVKVGRCKDSQSLAAPKARQ